MTDRPVWWHAHETMSPFRCHGGSDSRDIAVDLVEINGEDGLQMTLVESLDPPRICPRLVPGWAILHGVS